MRQIVLPFYHPSVAHGSALTFQISKKKTEIRPFRDRKGCFEETKMQRFALGSLFMFPRWNKMSLLSFTLSFANHVGTSKCSSSNVQGHQIEIIVNLKWDRSFKLQTTWKHGRFIFINAQESEELLLSVAECSHCREVIGLSFLITMDFRAQAFWDVPARKFAQLCIVFKESYPLLSVLTGFHNWTLSPSPHLTVQILTLIKFCLFCFSLATFRPFAVQCWKSEICHLTTGAVRVILPHKFPLPKSFNLSRFSRKGEWKSFANPNLDMTISVLTGLILDAAVTKPSACYKLTQKSGVLLFTHQKCKQWLAPPFTPVFIHAALTRLCYWHKFPLNAHLWSLISMWRLKTYKYFV